MCKVVNHNFWSTCTIDKICDLHEKAIRLFSVLAYRVLFNYCINKLISYVEIHPFAIHAIPARNLTQSSIFHDAGGWRGSYVRLHQCVLPENLRLYRKALFFCPGPLNYMLHTVGWVFSIVYSVVTWSVQFGIFCKGNYGGHRQSYFLARLFTPPQSNCHFPFTKFYKRRSYYQTTLTKLLKHIAKLLKHILNYWNI